MILYFAGSAAVEENYPELRELLKHRLLSYHYVSPSIDKYYYERAREHYATILMDSGAFSAWNNGAAIDIAKYADYCLGCIDKLDYVVNLDVIPSTPGNKKPPPEEVERSASAGFQNYYYLIGRGIPKHKLIHVFHQNEEFSWLERMLDEGMEYIGLSPANDRTTQEKIVWLRECMKYVTDSDGKPIVKFHGFAVTSTKIMRTFPWYSCDSSTWSNMAGRGDVYVPVERTREDGTLFWNYAEMPDKVSISQVKAKKDHYDHKTKGKRDKVTKYLKELNIPLGSFDFAQKDIAYELQEGERACSEKYLKNLRFKDPDEGKKWVEVVSEKGVLNHWKYRQYLNALYLTKFNETLPQFPVYTFPNINNFGL